MGSLLRPLGYLLITLSIVRCGNQLSSLPGTAPLNRQKITASEMDRVHSAVERAIANPTSKDRWIVVNTLLDDAESPRMAHGSRVQEAYYNGDLYMLHGNLGDVWTRDEWEQFYDVAKWAVEHHFKVVMNPVSQEADVAEAVQNPRTSEIIWSSHGSELGELYDTNHKVLPNQVFFTDAGRNFKHLTLSACNGDEVAAYYKVPEFTVVKHWQGDTTTEEMFGYLKSDSWAVDLMSAYGLESL